MNKIDTKQQQHQNCCWIFITIVVNSVIDIGTTLTTMPLQRSQPKQQMREHPQSVHFQPDNHRHNEFDRQLQEEKKYFKNILAFSLSLSLTQNTTYNRHFCCGKMLPTAGVVTEKCASVVSPLLPLSSMSWPLPTMTSCC